jgi:pimeloyl-ACP methyl ester carboxylesterase
MRRSGSRGYRDELGVRDALLFGHSMGAITAAVVAADRTDLARGLVLEDPPLDIPNVPDEVRRATMLAELGPWRELDLGARRAKARIVHPEWDVLETDPWADAKAVVDTAVVDHLGMFDGYDWRGILSRLECPGLLVTGEPALGAIVSERVAAEAASLWTSGRVLKIEGAGHCIHRDRWSESMAPIRSFLLRQVVPPGT